MVRDTKPPCSEHVPYMSSRTGKWQMPLTPSKRATPNKAQTPKNTILAPRRELLRRGSGSSERSSASRCRLRPRMRDSATSEEADMCSAAGRGPRDGIRPTLPPRVPCLSELQEIRVRRPPSEWKLSARVARVESSTSLSDSLDTRLCEVSGYPSCRRADRLRGRSSCCAASAAALATLAATTDKVR